MIDRERTIKEFGYDSDDLSKYSKRKIWAVCDDCGKERLLVFSSYRDLCKSCVKNGKRNSFYGKHHTQESKQKIRDNLDISGKNNPFYGKHHTIETKNKISISHKGKKIPSISGDKHPNWNPNLTDEERKNKRKYPKYYEWRIAVFKKDDYVCQICKEHSKTLVAHHLDGFNNNLDKRILLENGITLCEKHHKDFHHQYGYGNNTKEQFIEFKEGFNK